MKRAIRQSMLSLVLGLTLAAVPARAEDTDYGAAVGQWKSYQDVANWLDGNFRFDKERQKAVLDRLRSQGPTGLLAHRATTTFDLKSGYCTDAAEFALEALNAINAEYRPRYILIKNSAGPANHWVIGFQAEGKLYVIDYGPSPEWQAMKGVHGPYDSLDDYKAFLAGLSVPHFRPDQVVWRDMPGTVE